MRPFLLLSIRAVDRAADDEYESMQRASGLDERDLQRVRLDREPMGEIDLEDWSGIILGGGPFTVSDIVKSDTQERVEAELDALLDSVVARDHPFLGACYGIGTLGRHEGAVVDRTYPEPVGASTIRVTEAGRADPLFADLPDEFTAYVGHKEAISALPDHAVTLATSGPCPVQAFRVGHNVYATQFHPELDLDGIATRLEVYRHAGYFPPDAVAELLAEASRHTVVHPMTVLRRFVEVHAR